MSADARRYSRQTRLREVGAEGQERLCAAAVRLGSSGAVRAVEERYVRAAGMHVDDARPTVDPARVDREADPAPLGLRHAPAREVGEGALRALVAIRAVLLPDSR